MRQHRVDDAPTPEDQNETRYHVLGNRTTKTDVTIGMIIGAIVRMEGDGSPDDYGMIHGTTPLSYRRPGVGQGPKLPQ